MVVVSLLESKFGKSACLKQPEVAGGKELPRIAMMQIECIRDETELGRLARGWNSLLRASGSDSIFLTWEWVSTWWKIFGRGFSLRVLVVRDAAGEICGIAPLMIDDQCRLMIIGQRGETRAEYFDFIIRRGHEADVTPRLIRYVVQQLDGEWESVFFQRILKASPNVSPMLEALRRESLSAELIKEERAYYLELPGSWDDFLASRSKKFRNQWRNSCRRLEARGRIRVLLAGEDLAFDRAFEQLVRLNRARWGEKGSSFRTDRYLAFHREFARRILDQGWLCLSLLTVDDREVAASYDFAYAGKLWGMQGGWDPEFSWERVGTIITGKAIAWGIAQRLEEYDFLGGEEPYKRRWTSGERVMVHLRALRSAGPGL